MANGSTKGISCVCEHSAEQHWRHTKHCLAMNNDNTPCNCQGFTSYSTVQLSVMLNEQGEARVSLQLAIDTTIQLHPDACITLALEMLSAANQARVKEALAKYAITHDIPLQEILA